MFYHPLSIYGNASFVLNARATGQRRNLSAQSLRKDPIDGYGQQSTVSSAMTSAPSANLSHHILDLLAGVPTVPTEVTVTANLCGLKRILIKLNFFGGGVHPQCQHPVLPLRSYKKTKNRNSSDIKIKIESEIDKHESESDKYEI